MPTRYRALLQRLPLVTGSCLLLAAPLALEGCQKAAPGIGEGISDSTFVAVVAALRLAVMTGGVAATRDSAGQAAARDSILAKYKVTPAALESVASRLANRPKHAADIFGAIDHKVQSAPAPVVPRTVVPTTQPAVGAHPTVTPGGSRPAQPLSTPAHPAPARAAATPTPTPTNP